MSDNNSPPHTPPSPLQRRRSSFAEFFGGRSSTSNSSPPNTTTPAFPSTIASAAQAQQNRRRMSVNTLGISGTSPTNSSPFGAALARRRGSISSSQTSSSPGNEEAVWDENEATPASVNTPSTPFARRVSFGAQAYRDIHRSGSVHSGNNNGEGFSWSESMRDKATRTPSTSTFGTSAPANHHRAATVATIEPPKQMPQQSRQPAKPDVLGERMLRGDFMMD